MCDISRLKLQDNVKYEKNQSNEKGAPVKMENSPVSTMKVCTKCFSVIAPGKEHICNKTSLNNNMREFIQKKSPGTQSKLTCTILKTTATDCDSSTRGGVVELKSGSKPLLVSIGTPTELKTSPQFSHEDMKRVQVDHNLSDVTVK